MLVRILFIAILFLTGCGQMKTTLENNKIGSTHDSGKNTVMINKIKPFPDSGKSRVNVDSALNCEKLLHSLVNSSTFNPEVKKFKFKVAVDELSGGIATLKVSMRNTEHNEDVAIALA